MSHQARPVRVSASIPAGADEVFEFVADTRNDPVWCPNVTGVEQIHGSGVELGARFRFHQAVEAGNRILQSDVETEIVEIGERSIVWRVEDRFQIREIRLVVAGDDDTAVVTQTTSALFKKKPGLAKWVYPLLARRGFKDQFARLAEHFKQSAVGPPPT